MARVTKQHKDFQQGMSPDLYGSGLSRVEHADTTTKQLRPFGTLSASTMHETEFEALVKFAKGPEGYIYGLGKLTGGSPYPAVVKWDAANQRFDLFQSFNEGSGTAANVLYVIGTKIYGLKSGTQIWKVDINDETSANLNLTFQSLAYTNYADWITHSKDGLVYIPVDNKVYSFNGTDAPTLGITLPTNFVITSIAEQGNYINIVGYNSISKVATCYIWDRDVSLATFTEKYELGTEYPYHNAVLSGVPFIVSLRLDSGNTSRVEKLSLIIRTIESGRSLILKEYAYTTISLGGKYVEGDKMYFNAYIKPITESAGHWTTMQLDQNGRLSIAQNVGINDAGGSNSQHLGLVRDGDGFWIGGGADGSWNTTSTTFNTTTSFETEKYSAADLTKNLDTIGVSVSFEALPASSSVVLKYRKDESTAWTTLATFNTANSLKGSIQGSAIGTSKFIQFRAESTGGAVITGFQVDFEEIANETYG